MRTDRRLPALLLWLCFACNMPGTNPPPEVHGHRGCRALLPENTVPAFLKAMELGCDWLELDVVINADGAVVVSHEPWMDPSKCLGPDGRPIDPSRERELNIYRMSTAEMRAYDCGSLDDPDHPEREKKAAVKPLLSEVVDACDERAAEEAMPPAHFNIEIKSDPALYGTYQPAPVPFARIVMHAIDALGLADRCIIQSFDPAVLEEVHRIEPSARIALLVDNADPLEANLARLGFKPSIYSPAFERVDAALVQALRARDIEMAVWTVNAADDLRRMIDLGVDAIITDHPDRLIRMLEEEP